MKKSKPNYGYINGFNKDNYDRITIIAPKGSKDKVRDAAMLSGKNMSDFILSFLPKALIVEWKKKGVKETA